MTTGQAQPDRRFRSYEELERELMPKRAESRRSGQGENGLRDKFLEIVRRSIVSATREQSA